MLAGDGKGASIVEVVDSGLGISGVDEGGGGSVVVTLLVVSTVVLSELVCSAVVFTSGFSTLVELEEGFGPVTDTGGLGT